jgi:hypothetical protein
VSPPSPYTSGFAVHVPGNIGRVPFPFFQSSCSAAIHGSPYVVIN